MTKGQFTATSGAGEPTRAQDSHVRTQPGTDAVAYVRLPL